MTKEHGRAEQVQTAQLLCLLSNINRDPSKPPVTVNDCMGPYKKKDRKRSGSSLDRIFSQFPKETK
jgi:hypothetical protein